MKRTDMSGRDITDLTGLYDEFDEVTMSGAEYDKEVTERNRLRDIQAAHQLACRSLDLERAEVARLRELVGEDVSWETLAATEAERDEARDATRIWEDRCRAAEAEVARLREEVRTLDHLSKELDKGRDVVVKQRDEAREVCRNWNESFGCSSESDFDMYPWLEDE